ncbi:anti-sigma factor [Arthrobacter sp. B3I4]|uniref:anti-sigma factor n=1 Tax=Arthrobacter sp. B3I4 TaxID=3042267 RepID=UPI00277ED4B3|nr:anti-sigma factor [Arthrobacter sp. B3I4]MDQ0756247.1 hypothetical protein [Arthrobacter sp. B3I4]
MDHLDEELLGLLALGESAGEEESRHLESCQECGTTLEALRRTVFAATVNPEEVQLESPGSHNWAAIHQALGLSPSLAKDPLGAGGAVTLRTPGRQYSGQQPVTRLPRRGLWVLGVAAGVLLGAAGAWTALSILGPAKPPEAAPTSPGPTPAVVARAALAPLAGHSSSGSALVEKLPDGSRQVVVSLPPEKLSGFREVWMGSSDLSKMVSLGVLGQAPQAFVVPAGLDLAEYPVLDVSNEPYDGDPAHSAESIARGKLALQG